MWTKSSHYSIQLTVKTRSCSEAAFFKNWSQKPESASPGPADVRVLYYKHHSQLRRPTENETPTLDSKANRKKSWYKLEGSLLLMLVQS